MYPRWCRNVPLRLLLTRLSHWEAIDLSYLVISTIVDRFLLGVGGISVTMLRSL